MIWRLFNLRSGEKDLPKYVSLPFDAISHVLNCKLSMFQSIFSFFQVEKTVNKEKVKTTPSLRAAAVIFSVDVREVECSLIVRGL